MKEISHYNIIRFILFAIAPSCILLTYNPLYINNVNWLPISFYALLSDPLSLQLINILKWISYVFSLLASLGILFSVTSKIAVITMVFSIGYQYNFGTISHSLHLYLGALIILSFAPKCLKSKRDWHIELIKYWIVFVMLTLGLQKLFYGEGLNWAFSDTFYIRLMALPYHTPLATRVLDSNIILSQLLAAYSLFVVELFSPLALLNKRIGLIYFFIWSTFHIGVTLLMSGHYKFYSQVFVYCVVLPTPEILNFLLGWFNKLGIKK